jgi:hypothetical protein
MNALTRISLAATAAMSAFAGCQVTPARSGSSFAEIERLVRGKSAAEVLRLLGEPDSRQAVFDADERWIWWNFTYLDGQDCPPELRGRVVHLEIVFRNPNRFREERRPYEEWPIDDAFGIAYVTPATDG